MSAISVASVSAAISARCASRASASSPSTSRPSTIRSLTSRPAALRASCTIRISSRARPSRRSSGVISSSSATVTPPSDATPHPSSVSCTRCDVVRLERHLSPAGRDRGALSTLEHGRDGPVVRVERCGDLTHRRSEPRPEDPEVRLGPPAAAACRRVLEDHPLDVQLLGDEPQERLEGLVRDPVSGRRPPGGAGEHEPSSRSEPCDRARRSPDPGHGAVEFEVAGVGAVDGIVGEVDRVGCPVATGAEVAPQLLGDERGEGREQLRERHEAIVQGEERRPGVVALRSHPDPRTGAALGARTSSRGRRANGAIRRPALVASYLESSALHVSIVRASRDRIHRSSTGRSATGTSVRIRRVEPARVRVRHEEGVDVPQREQEPTDDVVERLHRHAARGPGDPPVSRYQRRASAP